MSDVQAFLQVKNITKRFYGVKVLDNVDLSIYPGEVIGVIGENGAGKSTLMKIISGAYAFEEGEVFLDGKQIHISSPAMMSELGVSMVYQDTKLIPELKVYQNIYLHNEIMKGKITDDKAMRDKSIELIKKVEMDIDVDEYVKYLSIAEKQSVEIAKAMSKFIRILILDEPTSSLTPNEVDKLFDTVNEIKKQGVTVVFISHRIQELLRMCDRFVVLRDGGLVGEIPCAQATEQNLAQMMVGREITRDFVHVKDPKAGDVILSVKNLSDNKNYKDISFDLHKGEVLGFYGIEGNGQREILRSICGLIGDYTGDIVLNGKQIHPIKPRHAIDEGITFITNDRHGENIFMKLPISKNLTIPNLKKWTHTGFVNEKIQEESIKESIQKFNIKCFGEKQLVQELSGGNQQKVSIAGRMLQGPHIFIFDEATLGVDVGAKGEIYSFIKNLVSTGIGVIMLSSDMTEILNLCDRILVVGGGELQKEMLGDEATEESIIYAAVKEKTFGHAEATKKKKEKKERHYLINIFDNDKWLPSYTVLSALALMIIVGGIINPVFVRPYNLGTILWQASPIITIALGQLIIFLTGHIDLSIGATMALVTCVLSRVMVNDQDIVRGIIIALLTGVAIGLLNAAIVVGLRIPHFVGTLATQTIIAGTALLVRDRPSGSISPLFSEIVKFKLGNWPVTFFVLVVVVVALEFFIQKTKPGIYIRATGSFREAAFYSGIPTNKVRVLAYVACGIIASIGGCILAVRLGSGDPTAAGTLAFQSVSSVIIGGVALSGGRGTAIGALMGAMLLITMQNFLNMMRLSTYWQYCFMGMMILISVAFYLFVDTRRQKKR